MLNIKHYKNFSKSAGFTLIELLITVFIFSLAFTATTFILTMNNRIAASISNNFVASVLAQEGVEVIRNIRDRDWFLGNAFGASIADGVYRIQWNSQLPISLGANPNLQKDNATGIFSYDTGSDTIFKRAVDISTITADVEKRVIVTVSWVERSGAGKSLIAEEHLYNWK